MKKKPSREIIDLQKQVAGLRVRLNRLEEYIKQTRGGFSIPSEEDDVDDKYLFNQALEIVLKKKYASSALLQRGLKIDYPRAARLMVMLEKKGVIGPSDGAKPRRVIIKKTNS